jgi:hypothetical protein
MECSTKVSEDREYIFLKVVGDFTAKDMMKCVVESHMLGQQLGIHCYLVDVTNARNIDSAMGNYEFAYSDMKTTEGVDPLARVAGLVSPGNHSHDFVETVSANSGMDLKLFTDLAEAIDYLKKKLPSGKSHK